MRPLVPAALGFAASLLLSEYIGALALIPVSVLAAVFTIWYLVRRSAGVSHLRASAAVFSCAAVAAALWHLLFSMIFYAPAVRLAGSYGRFTAVVRGYSEPYSYGSGVEAEIREANGARARLWFNEDTDFRPGDVVTVEAELGLPESSPDFDFLEYYRAKRVFLSGKVTEIWDVQRAERTPLRFLPTAFGHALSLRLGRLYDGDTLAVVRALTVGDRSDMSDALRLEIRASGLSHLLAISGLHVTLLCAIVLRAFGSRRRRGIPFALVIALLFVLTSGASPSAARAFVMHALALGAVLLRRDADSKSALSASLILLLLINPFSISDIGLQLSFLSTYGILCNMDAVSKRLRGLLAPKNRLLARLWNAVASAAAMTAVATVYTAPLIAYTFGSISLFGIFANIFATFFVPVALVGGLLSGLLAFVSAPAAHALGRVVTLAVLALRADAHLFSHIPFSIIDARDPYNLCALALGYVLLLIWRFSPEGNRHGAVCATAAGCALVLSMFLGEMTRRADGFEATVLDVGQGESILLRSGGDAALVDCGGDGYGGAGCIASERLMLEGTRHLEALILTHYHTDHANGVRDLLRFVSVDTAYVPLPYEESDGDMIAMLEDSGAEVVFIEEENLTLPFGKASLELLRPVHGSGENEEGISVLAERGDFSMLMTGDLGSESETVLVDREGLSSVEVCVAGHHGSRGSSSDYLLDRILPEVSLISVGYNTYGHPHPDTVARLEAHGCDIYRTDLGGHLRVRVG